MSKQKNYSLQQLSKETKIPESSVRYYRKQYNEYFPSTRLDGKKHPVFDRECIEVLKVIRKASDNGKEKHEILQLLGDKFSPIYDAETDKPAKEQNSNQQTHHKTLATTNPQAFLPPNFLATMKQMQEFNDNQTQLTGHYQTQNNQQADLIGDLKTKNDDLEKENKELKQQLKTANKPGILKKIFS